MYKGQCTVTFLIFSSIFSSKIILYISLEYSDLFTKTRYWPVATQVLKALFPLLYFSTERIELLFFSSTGEIQKVIFDKIRIIDNYKFSQSQVTLLSLVTPLFELVNHNFQTMVCHNTYNTRKSHWHYIVFVKRLLNEVHLNTFLSSSL